MVAVLSGYQPGHVAVICQSLTYQSRPSQITPRPPSRAVESRPGALNAGPSPPDGRLADWLDLRVSPCVTGSRDVSRHGGRGDARTNPGKGPGMTEVSEQVGGGPIGGE